MSKLSDLNLMNRGQQLGLALQPPLKSIAIDGGEYAIGILSEAQWADIEARAERMLKATKSGAALSEADANPARHLFHLLLAGDPNIRQVGRISAENIITAAQEIMRQAALRALVPMVKDPTRAEQVAQAEHRANLTEELVARQFELIVQLEARGLDTTDPERRLQEFRELLAIDIAGRKQSAG
jgi:hypothetical protein